MQIYEHFMLAIISTIFIMIHHDLSHKTIFAVIEFLRQTAGNQLIGVIDVTLLNLAMISVGTNRRSQNLELTNHEPPSWKIKKSQYFNHSFTDFDEI